MDQGKDDPEIELDERLRRLLDASTDAVFLASADGRTIHANAAACTMFGHDLDELRTLAMGDLVLIDARYRELSTERKRRGLHRGTLTLIRKGGERFEGEVTSAEIPSASAEPRLWVVVHDLAEHRRAEAAAAALRQTEETFRALAEASSEGVFLHVDGKILLLNAAMERMAGAKAADLIGRSAFDFVAPADRERVVRLVAQRPEYPYEVMAMRADGTVFPAEVQGRSGAIDFHGVPTRVVTLRDITARKQLEAQLARADRMASLGTLAAGVAHEINNPLAVVMLNLELARKALAHGSFDPAQLAEMLAIAAESSERVQRIVRDLRALARPVDEPPAEIDLGAVLAYVQSLASYEIRHRARLEVRIAPIGPVYGSRARLEQVVLNLVVNAAQAIPEDGGAHSIVVEVLPEGDARFAIVVRDTGVGIAPELLSRIFDPFVTSKEVGVGTGLGLSICHTIVTSLGGSIDVESEVGKGTTFRVVLPRGAPPAVTTAAPAQATSSRRGRILVVDDERHIREVMAQILDMHDVVAVPGAQAAIDLLERGEAFDVVLCDLMMPKLSGADFHDEVERRWPEVLPRILLMTGGAVTPRTQEVVKRAKNPPIEKPFAAAVLEERVAALLSR